MKYCSRDFDTYLTIEMLSLSPDGAGGQDESWSERSGLWGKVTDKGGGESELHGRQEATINIEVACHYRDDILTTDRLLLDGIYYGIDRLENVGRRGVFLKIYASSEVY